MKKILFSLLALACVACSKTQKTDDVVIRIIDEDMFSQCFTDCDTDGDGIVTKAEAENAKILVLDRGGRLNIIEDYTFLRAFPNLEALSVGNTTLETIDLSANAHLQRLNLQNALWINTLILAPDCNPEILYPQGIDSVTIERK
jgi:hypothetical protein